MGGHEHGDVACRGGFRGCSPAPSSSATPTFFYRSELVRGLAGVAGPLVISLRPGLAPIVDPAVLRDLWPTRKPSESIMTDCLLGDRRQDDTDR